MTTRRLLHLLLPLVLVTACRTVEPKVDLGAPGRSYTEKDYPTLLARWTRTTKIIKDLDTPLKVHATWMSPDFSAGYVVRYGQMFALPDVERRKMAVVMANERQDAYVFVMAAATHDYNWNDFHRRDTIWRLALVNDRQDQVAAKVISHDQRVSATTSALFPYAGAFYEVYRLQFPKLLPDGRPLISPETRTVTLRCSGPLGAADLVWRLQ